MVHTTSLTALAACLCLHAMAQASAVKKVPAPYTQPTSGEKVYLAYCASCHGAKGLGDGPVAPFLKGTLPDLSTLAQRNKGKYPSAAVSEIIRGESTSRAHGTSDMPVWGPVFRTIDSRSEGATNIRVFNLVKFIGTMQAN